MICILSKPLPRVINFTVIASYVSCLQVYMYVYPPIPNFCLSSYMMGVYHMLLPTACFFFLLILQAGDHSMSAHTYLSCSCFPLDIIDSSSEALVQVPASVVSPAHWESQHFLKEMSELLSVGCPAQWQAPSDPQWLLVTNMPLSCGAPQGTWPVIADVGGTVDSDQQIQILQYFTISVMTNIATRLLTL